MNGWAMAFPCLIYLACVGACSSPLQADNNKLTNTNVVTGIAYIYALSDTSVSSNTLSNFGTSYYSICLSLNVLLTLMIVARLIVHIWNLRKATGASGGPSGLHTATATAATMLIESYALYAVAVLLYIVPWAVDSWALYLFSGALGSAQVRVDFPLLQFVAAMAYCCLIMVTPR